MQVILLTDIKNIGRRGEIKTFPDGYVQNFLLPKKLAEIATKEKIAKIEQTKKQKIQHSEVQKELLALEIKKAQDILLEVNKRVNSSGTLFEKVDEKHIATLLRDVKHIHIPSAYIKIKEIIKNTGTYTVSVGSKKDIGFETTMTLVIKGQ
jgi:large subunit ribosomal protein L9